MGAALLDHRYVVSSLLCVTEHSRRFAGCHVGLEAPVRIVELRPPDDPRGASAWNAPRCASLAARVATLRHPALPRVRDCFCAGGTCYVVEDAPDGERLAARLASGTMTDPRAALRDGLLLCDAVARVASAAPEMLACLPITSTTLRYGAGGEPHLITWDYARWWGGAGGLDPGMPDLRAPEVRAGERLVPDERAHVYSIAALLSAVLAVPAALPDGDLPGAVRAALEPALLADPTRRTPDAESLGRALAGAARAVLPALGLASGAERTCRSQSHVERGRREAVSRKSAAAPRAMWQAGERSRAAIRAALRRTDRALNGSSCA